MSGRLGSCQGKYGSGVSFSNQTIHLVDFEGNTRTGVVEYGVVTLLRGGISAVYTRFCRGRAAIAAVDRQWHGIREEQVREAPSLESDWDLFSALRRNGPFGAHHAQVEDTLLRQVWPSPGLVPSFGHQRDPVPEWGPWIDTRRIYEYLFPDLESHQLMDLVRCFHLETTLESWVQMHCPEGRRKHHCALHDALASAVLLTQVPALPGFEAVDISWLLRHSASSQRVRDHFRQSELF